MRSASKSLAALSSYYGALYLHLEKSRWLRWPL